MASFVFFCYTVSPLGQHCRKPPPPKEEQEGHSKDRLLFDLRGRLGKSVNPFASVHELHLLPVVAGHILREFIC